MSISSQVSWQSAFWALPPLALNIMAQPSGRVSGFDQTLSFYLRSSPFVCLMDSLAALLGLVACINDEKSFKKAARAVRAHRKGDPLIQHRQISNQTLQVPPSIRVILFALGVLPQVIKLLACGGIPWTKAWLSMYLVPFLLFETLDLVAGAPTETEPDLDAEPPHAPSNSNGAWNLLGGPPSPTIDPSEVSRDTTDGAHEDNETRLDGIDTFFWWIAIGMQAMALLHGFHRALGLLSTNCTDGHRTLWLMPAFFAFSLYLLPLSILLYYFVWFLVFKMIFELSFHWDDRLDVFLGALAIFPSVYSLIYVLSGMTIFQCGIGGQDKAYNGLAFISAYLFYEGGALVIAGCLAGLLAEGIAPEWVPNTFLFHPEQEIEKERNRCILGLFAVVSITVCAYAFSFDPSSTFKPEWTNRLG